MMVDMMFLMRTISVTALIDPQPLKRLPLLLLTIAS